LHRADRNGRRERAAVPQSQIILQHSSLGLERADKPTLGDPSGMAKHALNAHQSRQNHKFQIMVQSTIKLHFDTFADRERLASIIFVLLMYVVIFVI